MSTPESSSSAGNALLNASALMASLTVKHLETSLAWYQGALGFVIDQKHERDGKLMGASLRAGAVRILLNADNGAKGWDRDKGEGMSMQLVTADDIDTIAARIKSNGGSLDSEPADMPWGARVFRVSDPDGFKFAISSERRG